MEHFFITGATGLLGQTLIGELKKVGEENITAFVLPNDPLRDELPAYVKVLEGNICDPSSLDSAIKENDIVIHLAAMVSIRKSDNEKMEKINYHGSVNVINAAIANKAKKLVYVSSSHVIGYKDGAPIKESDFGMKTENIGAYETSKKKATEYVFMKASEGLNASVVFPSGIVSDNDKAMGEISTLLYKLSTGKLTYYPRGGYAFVDVHDVARGIIAASKVGKKGEGYLLSGGYLSLDEIDSIVRERYPNLKKGRVIPFFFAYLGLPFIMIHEKISHHKPLYTYTSLKTIRTHALFDTSKAQKELGITFTPLKTSINNALSYIEKTAPKK